MKNKLFQHIRKHTQLACELINEKLIDLLPRLQPYWIRFKITSEKLFALSEHKSIRGSKAIVRVTSALFFILFLWASFFKIDQVSSADGQVIADSKTQYIQVADGGVLAELKVKEGDAVKQGQVVAVLEKERAFASYSESHGKAAALRARSIRLQSELLGKDPVYSDELKEKYPQLVSTELALFSSRRKSFLEQMAVLRDNVKLSEDELKMNLPLERYGDISKADILKLRRSANDAKGALALQANKYMEETSTQLNKVMEDLNSQEQVLADKELLLSRTQITAPTDGIVKSIRVTTIGGVIRQGDELLQILPTDSDLIIEAKVRPADMTYLKSGLTAKVKLDAYDYSIFGGMNGVISYISPDALTEETRSGSNIYYRIKILIKENDYKKANSHGIEVRPGMTAKVDIKTGNRSILSYILKPITKTLDGALGER